MNENINKLTGDRHFHGGIKPSKVLNIIGIIFIFISIIISSCLDDISIPIEIFHWIKSITVFMLFNVGIAYIYLVKKKSGEIPRWIGIVTFFLLGQEILGIIYSMNVHIKSISFYNLRIGYMWVKIFTFIYMAIIYKVIGINRKVKLGQEVGESLFNLLLGAFLMVSVRRVLRYASYGNELDFIYIIYIMVLFLCLYLGIIRFLKDKNIFHHMVSIVLFLQIINFNDFMVSNESLKNILFTSTMINFFSYIICFYCFIIEIYILKGKESLFEEKDYIRVENIKIFKNLIDRVPRGVLISNNNGDILYNNNSLLRILRCKKEDVLGNNLFSLMKNYNSDLDMEKLSENFKSHSIWEGEVNYIVNLQNKIFRCEILKLEYYNDESAVVTIFDDVTYKKKMNEKIVKNEKKLRDLTDNMLDFMINADNNGKIQYVSTSLCNVYGVNYKEIRGRNIYDLIYYKDRDEVKSFIKKRLNGESKEKQLEYRLKTNGDKHIWVESIMNPLMNNKGNVEGILIISRDIDRKKYFQRALIESEKKYRDFFNLVRNYIYVIDITKNIIVDMNEYMRQDFFIENDEVSISEIFGKDVSKLHFRYFYQILKGNKNLDFEFTTKNYMGEDIDLEVSLTPIYDNEEITRVVCMAKDITHKEKMKQLQELHEEDRRKLSEAIEYDRIKTEFLANISHELRTPINVIFSALQLEELRSKSNYGENGRYLRLMKQNCYRLLRLINNLIDVTKIEAGYLPIEYVNTDIVNVVENITMSIVDYAENKDIEVIFDTDMEERVISIDLDKTERVVMNILSNAIKFTSKKGIINVNLSEEEEYVKLSIKDTGRGIPKEKLKTVFERFTQVDKSLTRDHEGSGIGLYLVKSLMEMQGGTIEVNSDIGVGSEFIVKFPIVKMDSYKEVAATSDLGNSYVERISIEFSDIYDIN